MEDQCIMFIMDPLHTRNNDQGAFGAGVRNQPLSHKGLICMPWKDRIWIGVPVHPTEIPGGTQVKLKLLQHQTIMKTYILMSLVSPIPM